MENKQLNIALQKSLGQGKTVIGIDIGASSVNVAQSALYQGKTVIIKAVIENIVNKTGDQDRKSAMIQAIKNALSNFDTNHADVICTISNQKTAVDYIAMPLMPESELLEAIKLEVNNSQRFAIENPVFDYQMAGLFSDKNIEKNNIRVAMASKSAIDNLLSYFESSQQHPLGFLRQFLQVQDFMGLNLIKFIPVSIALENVINLSKSKIHENIVVLEMGSSSAELNIFKDGHLEFSRKINVTGFDFTRSLTSALSTSVGKVELNLTEAEWVKKEYGIPSASEEYLIKGKITANQVISLLRPKLEQLIKEITRSFDFYYDKNRIGKLDRLVLLGGGTLLKRLPEFLNAELGIPVTSSNSLQDVELLGEGVLGNKEDSHRLTLAIGAALAGSGGINLLPEQMRDSKKKFTQKIFMAMAAVALVAASVVFYLILFSQQQEIKNESAKLQAEYQSLTPSINDIKNKILIQTISNHRLDMGGVLRELSHLSDKVYLNFLDISDGNFTLSGIALVPIRDVKLVLKPLIADLKRASLQDVKIATVNVDADNNDRSDFTITATVGGSR